MYLLRLPNPDPGLESNRDETWYTQAACRDVDRRLFFEPEGEGAQPRARRVRAAKAVCAECPVRHECLKFALSAPEHYGIWGGLTARERATLRRRRPPGPSRRTDRHGP